MVLCPFCYDVELKYIKFENEIYSYECPRFGDILEIKLITKRGKGNE